jgi:hypothetical protein
MATLGQLSVELTANTAKFVGDLGKAAQVAQQSAKDISREFSSLQRVASQTFGAFGSFNPVISEMSFALSAMGRAASSAMKEFGSFRSGIGAITSLAAGAAVGFGAVEVSMIGMAMKAVNSAAEMEHLAEKSGVTVEEMSGLSFAAKQVNISQEELSLGLARLSKNAEMAAQGSRQQAEAFKALHVSATDAHGALRPIQDILLDIADRFSKAKDSTAKTAIAMAAFGKAGYEMVPMLNLGSQGIAAFIKTAEELGIILDTRTAKGAVQLEQQMNVLASRFQAFEITLARDLLPTLEVVITSLTEVGRSADATAGSAQKLEGAAPTSGWVSGLQDTVLLVSQLGVGLNQASVDIENLVASLGDLATLGTSHILMPNFWGVIQRDNEAIKSQIKSVEELAEKFKRVNELEAQRPQMKADILAFAGGGAVKATAEDAKNLSTYLDGLSGEQLKKIGQDALAAHKNVADFAMALMKASSGSLNLGEGNAAAEAQKKLQSALEAVIKKYTEARATAGLLAFQIEDYKLKILGATAAQIAHVDSLRELAAANRLAAQSFNASVLKDVAERGKQAGLAADGLAVSIETAARAADSLNSKPLFLGLSTSLLQDTATKAKTIIDELKEKIANFGKSDIELKIEALGLAAAPEDLASIQALQHKLALKEAEQKGLRVAGRGPESRDYSKEIEQLNTLKQAIQAEGESTLLVDAAIHDANQRLIEQWDQAALKVGTLKERFTALFDEVKLQGDNLGDKLFSSMSKSIDDISTQLAKFVVTGKTSFHQLAQSFEESIAKATFQKGIGTFTGSIEKIFQKKPEVAPGPLPLGPGFGAALREETKKGPLGTPLDPLYVILSGAAEAASRAAAPGSTAAPGGANASNGIDTGLPMPPGFGSGNIPDFSAATAAIKTPPFLPTDLGSSLDNPPASPAGASGGSFLLSIGKLLSHGPLSLLPGRKVGEPFDVGNTSQIGSPPTDLGSSLDNPPAAPGGGSGGGFLSSISKIFHGTSSSAGGSGNNSSAALSAAASALRSSATSLTSAAEALKAAASSLSSSGGVTGGSSSDSGGGGGFLSDLAGMFGGGKASGGDVSPGMAYLVGERRPEIFLPKVAGTILPSASAFTSSFARMGSKFGGYRAAGGDVTPGSAYLTGERQPEVFLPNIREGSASPMAPGSQSRTINLGGVHFHGVQDVDSFRRSQTQIMAQLHSQIDQANKRAR